MRNFYVTEALTSSRRLAVVIDQLTEEELMHVISLEEAAQRRATILDKLYREARQRARKKFHR